MLESLPSIPLFHDLAPTQTTLLKLFFEQYSCPSETKIFEQGEPANFLYLLIKGLVAIKYKPYDSPSIILTRLRAGDAFGWSAAIGSAYYTSSIVSESRIESVRIKGEDLRKLVRDHPETGKVIIERLADIVSSRWKNAHAQVQSILNSDQTNEQEKQ